MRLKDIVKDWGGFEELIKSFHQDGEVEVERNVTLIGQSGASRQIDVLIKHTKGPYKYSTLIECKYWNKKVERANIDVLYASMLDLNASKGVFFTTKGYQNGAEIYAKSKNITIFVVRELTNEEWGSPGQIIEFYLQVILKSILNITPLETKAAFAVNCKEQNPGININLGLENDKSSNIIISEHKSKYKTLENVIEFIADECLKQLVNKQLLINGGEDCTRYLSFNANVPCVPELQVFNPDKIVYIPRIEVEVGVKVIQSKIRVDRSASLDYALAVHDCVNQEIYATSKRRDSEFTTWQKLADQRQL